MHPCCHPFFFFAIHCYVSHSSIFSYPFWDCSVQYIPAFHHTERAQSIFDFEKSSGACAPCASPGYMITSFVSVRWGRLCRFGAHGASLTAAPYLTHQIREKSHTACSLRTCGVHSRSPVHTCRLSPHKHEHSHTRTFFIIIPELIGSNYLPWL